MKKGNLLIAYTKNMKNPDDLDNYLNKKTINLYDWVWAIFWKFMLTTNFSNHYRYDHIIRKPDIIYDYEMLKKYLNLGYRGDDNDVI